MLNTLPPWLAFVIDDDVIIECGRWKDFGFQAIPCPFWNCYKIKVFSNLSLCNLRHLWHEGLFTIIWTVVFGEVFLWSFIDWHWYGRNRWRMGGGDAVWKMDGSSGWLTLITYNLVNHSRRALLNLIREWNGPSFQMSFV